MADEVIAAGATSPLLGVLGPDGYRVRGSFVVVIAAAASIFDTLEAVIVSARNTAGKPALCLLPYQRRMVYFVPPNITLYISG